jgi:cysteine desulfurase
MTRSTIYLDHNASTPVDEKVIDKIVAAMRELPANPSSVDHREGAAASAAVEEARERVAKGINARSADIIFVSGATEANKFALSDIKEYAQRHVRKHRKIELRCRIAGIHEIQALP